MKEPLTSVRIAGNHQQGSSSSNLTHKRNDKEESSTTPTHQGHDEFYVLSDDSDNEEFENCFQQELQQPRVADKDEPLPKKLKINQGNWIYD